MNGFYEIALHTVVMVWFWWILLLTAFGIFSAVKDVTKLIRKHSKSHKKTTENKKTDI